MMVSKSFSSLFLTLGVVAPLAGALASTACSSKFEGCASSRSCPSDAGEGGGGGSAGKGGSAGSGGSAGKGGVGGNAGSASMGGESGEAGASAGKGGTGGSGGTASGGAGGTGGSAGSSTDPMGGEGGTETDPERDVTPPTIVSVSPTDDETGVLSDAVIRITFSEPMDRPTAELAYQSADIPASATTRRWNGDDTVLTITPNAELMYQEGEENDLAFDAIRYALELTDTAEDKAGNRLVPEAWSFSTLRRLNQTLVADGDDVRRFNGTANAGCTNTMDLGDYRTNEPLAGFVQFDLSELAPGATTFEVAQFYGERTDTKGDPRALDGVHLYEFEGDIMEVDLMASTGPDLGVFLDSFTDAPRLSVLPAMTSSYAADDLIQLRMKVVPDSDGDDEDDYFRLRCAFELRMTYLAP
jgi:hypothetical protein